MGLSVSYHISTGKKGSSALSCADKHNERKYRKKNIDEVSSYINFDLSKHNVILIGSKNLYKDVKELYKKEFKSSVDEYNSRQKRADRKIYDYFEKISNDKKTNLYTELVIQIGDMNYWKDKTLEEKKKMVGVFEKQLELSQKFYPNFKIANATVHLDESSPHIHVVGVCSSNEELSLKNFPEKKRKKKNGLKNYVSQNEVFTQNNMKEFHQFFDKKSVEIFNEVYKTNEILNDKQLHQEHLSLAEFKKVAPTIKKTQKEYDDLKLKKEVLKNDVFNLKNQKENLKKDEKKINELQKEIDTKKENLEKIKDKIQIGKGNLELLVDVYKDIMKQKNMFSNNYTLSKEQLDYLLKKAKQFDEIDVKHSELSFKYSNLEFEKSRLENNITNLENDKKFEKSISISKYDLERVLGKENVKKLEEKIEEISNFNFKTNNNEWER